MTHVFTFHTLSRTASRTASRRGAYSGTRPRLIPLTATVATALLLGTALTRPALAAAPVPPVITYLGQLLSGGTAVANGNYDFQFTLYDASTGGNVVGSTLSVTSVPVSNGVFYVELNLAADAGTTLYLQTAYRKSGTSSYTTQGPRKLIPTTSYADYAAVSGSTTSLQGFFVSARAPTDGQVLTWNASGSKWLPQTPVSGTAYTAGTGLSLSGTQFSVASGGITNSLIATNAVSNSKLANGSVSGPKLSLPLTASVSSSSDLFTITNTSSGRAIVGNSSSGTALKGVGYNGVYGQGTHYGVQASGTQYGVYSVTGSSTGTAVYGANTSSDNGDYGLLGGTEPISGSNYPVGVFGNNSSNYGYGVEGSSSNGTGVYGSGSTGVSGSGTYGVSGSGSSAGVYGSGSTGVYGYGSSYGLYGSSSGNYGVYGTSSGYGIYGNGSVSGLYGISSNNIGVYGKGGPYGVVGEGSTDAGYFYGNVYVNGTLSKAGGSFKIDDPIDPAHKTLSHSFVESPDMKNIYDGTITTDANGNATITMPDWFEALNQDFRYQLTCIGQFAQAIVATEVDGNQFTIKTDKPNVKVSWQVTGTRHDAWANAHRIPTEEDKPAAEQGLYLNPKEFGQPEQKGISYQHLHAAPLHLPTPASASAPQP